MSEMSEKKHLLILIILYRFLAWIPDPALGSLLRETPLLCVPTSAWRQTHQVIQNWDWKAQR